MNTPLYIIIIIILAPLAHLWVQEGRDIVVWQSIGYRRGPTSPVALQFQVPLAPQIAAQSANCRELKELYDIDQPGYFSNTNDLCPPDRFDECALHRREWLKAEMALCKQHLHENIAMAQIWDHRTKVDVLDYAIKYVQNPEIATRGKRYIAPLLSLLRFGLPILRMGMKAIKYSPSINSLGAPAKTISLSLASSAVAAIAPAAAAHAMKRVLNVTDAKEHYYRPEPVWALRVKQVSAIVSSTHAAGEGLRRGAEKMVSRRLAPGLVAPDQVRAVLNRAKKEAAKKGIELLASTPLEIYDSPASHEYTQTKMTLNVSVWIDSQVKGSGAKLLHARLLPLIISPSLTLKIVLPSPILAFRAAGGLSTTVTSEEMAECSHEGALVNCPFSSILPRVEEKSCIVGLKKESAHMIAQYCRFRPVHTSSQVLQTGDSIFQLHAPTEEDITRACQDDRGSKLLPRGLWQITVDSSCSVDTSEHTLLPASDLGVHNNFESTRLREFLNLHLEDLLRFGELENSEDDPLINRGLTISELQQVLADKKFSSLIQWALGALLALSCAITGCTAALGKHQWTLRRLFNAAWVKLIDLGFELPLLRLPQQQLQQQPEQPVLQQAVKRRGRTQRTSSLKRQAASPARRMASRSCSMTRSREHSPDAERILKVVDFDV
jgi:hypothetical protein